jgi:hypothetical protein
MSYTFQFPLPVGTAVVSIGDKCEFYKGAPYTASQLGGETDPIMTDTVDSQYQATFTAPAGTTTVAIVLKKGSNTYARSNSMNLSQFSKTEVNWIYVTPVAKTLTLADLRGFMPPTPFTEANITITSATLSLSGGKIKVSGKAKSDGWWFFDFSLDYEYTFSLVPVKTPVWLTDDVELAVVQKEDFNLTGKGIIQDVLLLFGKGTIRNRFEERLQSELDAVVTQELAALPDDYAPTISSVNVGTSSVTLSIYLVGTQPLCAFSISPPPSTRSKARTQAQVNKMRSIRDTMLQPTASGKAYVAALEEHQAEISRLASGDNAVAKSFHEALDLFLADNATTKSGPILSRESVAAAKTAIAKIRPIASPALRSTIDRFEKDLTAAKPGTLSAFLRGEPRGKRKKRKS